MDKAVTPAVLKKDDEEPPKAVTSEVPPKPEPKKVDPSKAMPPKTVPPAVLKKDNEEPPKPGPSKAMPPKPLPPTVLKKDDKNRKVRVDYIQFTRTEPSPVAVVVHAHFLKLIIG